MSEQFNVYLVREKDKNYLEFNKNSRATWHYLSDDELSILTKKLETKELSNLRTRIAELDAENEQLKTNAEYPTVEINELMAENERLKIAVEEAIELVTKKGRIYSKNLTVIDDRDINNFLREYGGKE